VTVKAFRIFEQMLEDSVVPFSQYTTAQFLILRNICF